MEKREEKVIRQLMANNVLIISANKVVNAQFNRQAKLFFHFTESVSDNNPETLSNLKEAINRFQEKIKKSTLSKKTKLWLAELSENQLYDLAREAVIKFTRREIQDLSI